MQGKLVPFGIVCGERGLGRDCNEFGNGTNTAPTTNSPAFSLALEAQFPTFARATPTILTSSFVRLPAGQSALLGTAWWQVRFQEDKKKPSPIACFHSLNFGTGDRREFYSRPVDGVVLSRTHFMQKFESSAIVIRKSRMADSNFSHLALCRRRKMRAVLFTKVRPGNDDPCYTSDPAASASESRLSPSIRELKLAKVI
ncbi:hypothetical protein K438DRAFT_1758048 [Mycena galopus ATCC 62051]|nr:hypothetical protein K438DRAFT_1758048 [Mycena galopus ATCC 62051]